MSPTCLSFRLLLRTWGRQAELGYLPSVSQSRGFQFSSVQFRQFSLVRAPASVWNPQLLGEGEGVISGVSAVSSCLEESKEREEVLPWSYFSVVYGIGVGDFIVFSPPPPQPPRRPTLWSTRGGAPLTPAPPSHPGGGAATWTRHPRVQCCTTRRLDSVTQVREREREREVGVTPDLLMSYGVAYLTPSVCLRW